MDKWDVKQIMDLVSKSLNSLLINSNKQWTKAELLKQAKEFADVYLALLMQLKSVKTPETLPRIDDKGNVAVEEDEHLEKDLEKLEEIKAQKAEELKRDAEMEEALIEGTYKPLEDLPKGNWREPTPEENQKVLKEIERQHTEHLI